MTSFLAISLLLTAVGVFCLPNEKLLKDYAMIMSHDAATGEINQIRDRIPNIVLASAQTQSKGLVAQLTCGSRSFDYRPYYSNGTVYASHGIVVIKKPMNDSVSEIIKWVNRNPTDLVILYLSHFAGDDGSQKAATDILDFWKVPVISACDEFSSLTYNEAKTLSLRSDGGYLLGIVDCMDEVYDPSVECYVKDVRTNETSVCFESNNALVFNQLTDYAHNASAVKHSGLWMSQLHWQYGVESTVLQFYYNSTVVDDTTRSGVNDWVLDNIRNKTWPNLNFVELNEVCASGKDIYEALKVYDV